MKRGDIGYECINVIGGFRSSGTDRCRWRAIGRRMKVPEAAAGVVIFAHGSGSSRHSPRNQFVARMLREAGLGTLLFDLLTQQEEAVDLSTRHLRFDIGLLAERLVD